MKTIVILLDSGVKEISDYYITSYSNITDVGKQKGCEVFVSSPLDYSLEMKLFQKVWKLEKGKFCLVENIRPDIVWYKSNNPNYFAYHIADKYSFVNDLSIVRLCADKFATARVFHDVSPTTYILDDVVGTPSYLDEITSEKLVIKPITGFGGKGVELVEKSGFKKYMEDFKFNKRDYIIQEFIDSSCGVKGVVDDVHDIRAVCIGNKIQVFTIREPKKGDFRCNVGTGGYALDTSPEFLELPHEFIKFFENINERLNYSGIFSIDCVLATNGKIYLQELNSAPGVDISNDNTAHQKVSLKRYHNSILDYLIERI